MRLTVEGLEVRSGEILGIAGVEGNGQTELILRLARQLKPAHIPEDRHARGLVLSMPLTHNLLLGREKGYTRALAKHRIAPDRLLMLNGDLSEVSGYALCRSLLVSAVPPTAIVCATDAMAIGAIAACRERGMAVGREISIAGYGNSSASGFCDPPLTTIDHAVFENGRHIGQSLLRLLRAEAKPADIHYLEPVVLVPRKSDCQRK